MSSSFARTALLGSESVMELRSSHLIKDGDVHGLALDGKTLALTCGDKMVRVFNAPDMSEKAYSPLLLHKYHVIGCILTSAGDRLVCCSMDGKASIVDLNSGKLLAVYSHPSTVGMRTCCLTLNDHLLAVGATNGSISVLEMDSYKTLITLSMNDDESILALSFTPDSKWLLAGHSVTGNISVWNSQYLTNKYTSLQMAAHELGTNCLDMSSKPHHAKDSARKCYMFASGGADNLIYLWSISYDGYSQNSVTLRKTVTLMGHTAAVYCVKFSPDGECLLSCGGDQTVRLWNLDGECAYVNVDAHKSFINSCAFSPDMKLVYTASSDKTVKVWNLTDIFSLDTSLNMISGEASLENSTNTAVTSGHKSRRVGVISSWSVEDVCFWLNQLGLSKYSPAFQKNDIDGAELMHIDNGILEKELGIISFGARNKILNGLEELKAFKPEISNAGNSEVPNEFLCPIMHQIMIDPVVAADGYTYERKAIDGWIQKGNTTSPMTNAELNSLLLIPNTALRTLINNHNHPNNI